MESPDTIVVIQGEVSNTSPWPRTDNQGDNNEDTNNNNTNSNDGDNHTPKPKTTRHRGRQAKDPLGQSIVFKCLRVEDMEAKLREYLANPTGDPVHTTLEFTFPVSTAFMVSARERVLVPPDKEKKPVYRYGVFNKRAVSVIEALDATTDAQDQAMMQRAISKTLAEAVAEADGYRYSYHNSWFSREDQAHRFSYFCNDSVLNKGRAASEGAALVRRGVKVRKKVFECEGLLAVKFSATKMNLELHYKHIPLHETFEARAPPPRKDSKRRRLLEIFHPDKLPKPVERKKQSLAPRPEKGTKRKRRATEPLPQPAATNDNANADAANENDSASPAATADQSLRPLFDFLGSAGQLEDERPLSAATSEPAARRSSAEPEATVADSGDGPSQPPGEPEGVVNRRGKPLPYPGMRRGFLSGESNITWGNKKRQRKGRYSDPAPLIPTPSSAPAHNPTTAMTGGGGQPPPLSDVDALKARLQEAEQKIRELEAEKHKAVTPITWEAARAPQPPQQRPPPGPPQAQYFPQPPPHVQHFPPPQGYPGSQHYAPPGYPYQPYPFQYPQGGPPPPPPAGYGHPYPVQAHRSAPAQNTTAPPPPPPVQNATSPNPLQNGPPPNPVQNAPPTQPVQNNSGNNPAPAPPPSAAAAAAPPPPGATPEQPTQAAPAASYAFVPRPANQAATTPPQRMNQPTPMPPLAPQPSSSSSTPIRWRPVLIPGKPTFASQEPPAPPPPPPASNSG